MRRTEEGNSGKYANLNTANLEQNLQDISKKLIDAQEKMTFLNLETLDAIQTYFDKNGWMPNVRDLLIPLNLKSTSAVIYRLEQLEELCLITREEKQSKLKISHLGKLVLGIARDEIDK